jgi:heat-inducible transcriptional repressor
VVDERKRRVLQAIVDDYIHTAEPVGSRTVARKYNLGVSPATIRNEMADLEDMGYLEQPHSSAGRVPSDKGYRFYVDTLAALVERNTLDAEAVRQVLALKAQRIEGVVRQAAHLLAETTDFLALASQPTGGEERLAALQVVPVRGAQAVVILVADDGRVRTKSVEFAHAPSPRDLERIGRALSDRLAGTPLKELARGLLPEIAVELGQFCNVVDQVKALLGDGEEAGERLVVGGATNLLKQPEFREVAKAKAVLQALEGEQLLEEMLGFPASNLPGVEVAIGREMQIEQMADCSLVTAVYAAPGGVLGRIGVLGPRRMDYGRVMRVVEGVAAAVTTALGREGPASTSFPSPAAGPRPEGDAGTVPSGASPSATGGGEHPRAGRTPRRAPRPGRGPRR